MLLQVEFGREFPCGYEIRKRDGKHLILQKYCNDSIDMSISNYLPQMKWEHSFDICGKWKLLFSI